ncbi:MAG: glycosyltransferase family 9 protein [Bacteroidota bacterium]
MTTKSDHILVIRLSAMGDVAMVVPVLERLLITYPKLKVTVLTKSFFTVFFEDLPRVNVKIAEVKSRHKGVNGLWKLSNEISDDIDAVADLHNVLRSKLLRRFLSLRGTKTKKIDKGRRAKKALTRLKNKRFQALKTSFERYAEVFDQLGFPVDLSIKIPKRKLTVSEQEMKILGLTHFRKTIAIAPFAAHQSKVYAQEKLVELLRYLNQQEDYKVLLFGGGKKEEKALAKLADGLENVQNVAGRFSFKTELAIISNVSLMISMDSGNGHLAAMYQVPVITIWGSTHPFAGFAPFGQSANNQILPDLSQYPLLPTSIYGNKQIDGYENVMESINQQEIIERIHQIID